MVSLPTPTPVSSLSLSQLGPSPALAPEVAGSPTAARASLAGSEPGGQAGVLAADPHRAPRPDILTQTHRGKAQGRQQGTMPGSQTQASPRAGLPGTEHALLPQVWLHWNRFPGDSRAQGSWRSTGWNDLCMPSSSLHQLPAGPQSGPTPQDSGGRRQTEAREGSRIPLEAQGRRAGGSSSYRPVQCSQPAGTSSPLGPKVEWGCLT